MYWRTSSPRWRRNSAGAEAGSTAHGRPSGARLGGLSAVGKGAWAVPWFPDFVSAAELARRETRAVGRSDPVGEYLDALTHGDDSVLESAWPGEVVVYDPRAGEVRGGRRLRRFVRRN